MEIDGYAKVIPRKILRGFPLGGIKENQTKEAGVAGMKRGICAVRIESDKPHSFKTRALAYNIAPMNPPTLLY